MEWYRTTLRLDPDLHTSLEKHAKYFGCSKQHLLRELLRIGLEKMQEFTLLSPEDQALFMPENEGVVVLPSLSETPTHPGEGRKKSRLDRRADVVSHQESTKKADAVLHRRPPTREE